MLVLALVFALKPPYPHANADTSVNKQVVARTAPAEPAAVPQTPPPQPQPVAQEEAPAPAPEPTPVQPTTYHSDDFYMEYIFQHESSGNPYARNSIGCLGLGQACPAEKLLSICPDLGDVACQVQFFTNYAVSRYGSWAAAYEYWLQNHWW